MEQNREPEIHLMLQEQELQWEGASSKLNDRKENAACTCSTLPSG